MDLHHRCETIVSEHFFDSDHCIVTTNIDCRTKEVSPPIQRWNLRKAKWNLFTKSASVQLSMLTNTADVDQFNDDISAALIRAANVAIPKTPCKLLFKNPVPWWNDKCAEAVKLKKGAFNKMKRTWDPNHITLFKRTRAECRKIILNAKRESWRKFCESLNEKENFGKVWRMTNSFFGRNKLNSIPSLVIGDSIISMRKIKLTRLDKFSEE